MNDRQYEYCFDISYYMDTNMNDENDNLINEIISQYPSCVNNASEINQIKNKDVKNTFFSIASDLDLKSIIRRVNREANIWIDFVTGQYENGDSYRIYSSINELNKMDENFAEIYNNRNKEQLNGTSMEIHRICMLRKRQ